MLNNLPDVLGWLKRYTFLLEVIMWLSGITALALMNPEGEHLFSFCPFSWLLESGCLGCGLGHAIAYLFRGEWQASWEAHPLALPALVLLAWRCVKLLHWQYKHFNYLTINKYHG
ncbi:DUF2752 domain-containing protein [Pontibacter locisalis]|uniref:DUF2752 domain-containing protein n=1 Tax=Pontibacter locisalis TaxID=1719035 RepID=A0ABW5IIW6_9BACT